MTFNGRDGRRIRVALADDHPVVLAGIRTLLQAAPEIELVGEALDGKAALELLKITLPDVAVLDLSMPEINGIDLAIRLAQDCPSVKVIALTIHEDRAYVQPLIQAGARGFLLKGSAAEDLVRAVRAVAQGGIYLDPMIADKALPEKQAEHGLIVEEAALSPREENVLKLTAQGFSNKQIAGQLDVSTKTVETYKARASDKLRLRSRAQIVRYAAEQGWLSDLTKQDWA